MKATEFCYWLQGAFELTTLTALTSPMLECIKKHLALVKETNQAGQPKLAVDFCSWLAGGVDFINHEDMGQTETVRKRLADAFEHAIDKMYENGATLDLIHGNGLHYKPGMRC